jgi:hypothetical protein
MLLEDISQQMMIMKFIMNLIENTKKAPDECLETFFKTLDK